VVGLPAHAQINAFDIPTAGIVYSYGSRAIRPVIGFPGSAYIGKAILTDLNESWVAPGGKWAIVNTPDHSGLVNLLAAPSNAAVTGMIDGIDRAAWSRDASFAVLYSSSTAQLQRIKLSNNQVSLDPPMDLGPWGVPATLAIDPAGLVAFGITGAGLYVVNGNQTPTLLLSMIRPTAAAFSDSGRLYAVDRETARIVEFAADGSPSDFATVEVSAGAEFQPVGLAVSGSGKYVVVADRGTQSLRVWETATRTPLDSIPLDFVPAVMERLAAGSTFLLNRPRATEWLLVLDATDIPRVYFVPAGEGSAQ
jgi:hypothetical protein